MNDDEQATIIEAVARRVQEIAEAFEMRGIKLRSPITMLAMLAHVNGIMLDSTVKFEDLVMKKEGEGKEGVH